jgi:hypothetical protein
MGMTQSGVPVPDGMVKFLDSNTVVSKFTYFEGKCIRYFTHVRKTLIPTDCDFFLTFYL